MPPPCGAHMNDGAALPDQAALSWAASDWLGDVVSARYRGLLDAPAVLARLKAANICTLGDVARTPNPAWNALCVPIGLRNFLKECAKACQTVQIPGCGAHAGNCPVSPAAPHTHRPVCTARGGLYASSKMNLWPPDEDGKVRIMWVADEALLNNPEWYKYVTAAFAEISHAFNNDLEFIDRTAEAHAATSERLVEKKELRRRMLQCEVALVKIRECEIEQSDRIEETDGLLEIFKRKRLKKRYKKILMERERCRNNLRAVRERLRFLEEHNMTCAYGSSTENTLLVRLMPGRDGQSSLGDGTRGCEPSFIQYRGTSDKKRKNYLYAQAFFRLWPEEFDVTIEAFARENNPVDKATVIHSVIIHEMGHCLGLCHTFEHPTLAKRVCEKYHRKKKRRWLHHDRIDLGSAMMYDAEELRLRPAVKRWLADRGLDVNEIGCKPCFSLYDIQMLRSVYWPGEDAVRIPMDTTWPDVARPGEEWVLEEGDLAAYEDLIEDLEVQCAELEEQLNGLKDRIIQATAAVQKYWQSRSETNQGSAERFEELQEELETLIETGVQVALEYQQLRAEIDTPSRRVVKKKKSPSSGPKDENKKKRKKKTSTKGLRCSQQYEMEDSGIQLCVQEMDGPEKR